MPNTTMRLINVNGIVYAYDGDRSKMLSISKEYVKAGIKRRTVTNEFLHVEDGQPTMSVGYPLIRPATITGLIIHCETAASWVLHILRLGSPSPLVSLAMSANTIASNQVLNRDVVAGSVLQLKAEGTNIPFPRAILELAWKL